MNWLAHFTLSSHDDHERLGNWLADLFGPSELDRLSDSGVRRGLELHRLIDRTTDRHPRMRAALTGLPPGIRRGGGILLDVFWDHFLSCEFAARTGGELQPFIVEVLDSLNRAVHLAPAGTRSVLDRMRGENWLGAYGTVEGVELTLNRIAGRLSPKVREVLAPARAAEFLETHREVLRADFGAIWGDVGDVVARFRRAGADPPAKL